MSDALEIMEWCGMPATRDGYVPAVSVPKDEMQDRHWVTQAERVLIERGRAREYGEALMDEVFLQSTPMMTGANATAFATAPLDARVRAMLAVIRAQT